MTFTHLGPLYPHLVTARYPDIGVVRQDNVRSDLQ